MVGKYIDIRGLHPVLSKDHVRFQKKILMLFHVVFKKKKWKKPTTTGLTHGLLNYVHGVT